MDRERDGKAKILPIPTKLMDAYVQAMQARLKAKGIGGRKEFLRELLKQVRIDGDKVTITYRLLLDVPPGQRTGSLQCVIWWRRGESNPRPKVFHQI